MKRRDNKEIGCLKTALLEEPLSKVDTIGTVPEGGTVSGEKLTLEEQKIIDSWVKALRERGGVVLSSEERAQFEEEAFAEEQARKTPFVLGEPLRRRL